MKNGAKMNIPRWVVLFLLLLFVFPPMLFSQLPREAIITNIEGKVEVLFWGQTAWKPAPLNMILKENDKVRVPADGMAIIAIKGSGRDTMVKLEGGTEIAISELSLDPSTGADSTLLDMVIGSILIDTEPIKGSQFRVKTPTALVGAKGTSFRVTGYKVTDAALYKGTHPITVASLDRAGNIVDERSVPVGEKVVGVELNKKVPAPVAIPDDEMAEALKEIDDLTFTFKKEEVGGCRSTANPN